MGLIKNTVHYCCVSRDNQILYAYNGGDGSNESLAALCLEKSPPFHDWYFESIGKRRFGFLIGDGFVYFAIVDVVLGKFSVLKFLEHLRDEFKKAARKNCRGSSFTAMIGSINVDDQLVPVVSKLVAALERVAEANNNNNDLRTNSHNLVEAANSTKAPLLGKLSKQEKKKGKGKDHVIPLKGIELEEEHYRKSNDRGNIAERCDGSSAEAATSSHKEYVPSRGRSGGSQSVEWKWRRIVQIVLAIDAAICLTLFGIWLAICRGIECTRS